MRGHRVLISGSVKDIKKSQFVTLRLSKGNLHIYF